MSTVEVDPRLESELEKVRAVFAEFLQFEWSLALDNNKPDKDEEIQLEKRFALLSKFLPSKVSVLDYGSWIDIIGNGNKSAAEGFSISAKWIVRDPAYGDHLELRLLDPSEERKQQYQYFFSFLPATGILLVLKQDYIRGNTESIWVYSKTTKTHDSAQ